MDSPFQTIRLHKNDINGVAFGRNQLLASCSSDSTIQVYQWKVGEGYVPTPFSPLRGHKYGVTGLSFSPYGTILCSCSIDGTSILWDMSKGDMLLSFVQPGSSSAVRVCGFSHNSAHLITGGDSGQLFVWDIASRKLLKTLNGHDESVFAACFTPQEGYLVSGCSYGLLNLWNIYSSGLEPSTTSIKPAYTRESAHDLGVTSIDFSSEIVTTFSLEKVCLCASGGNDNLVKLWNVYLNGVDSSIEPLMILSGHSSSVMSVRIAGIYIASTSGDKSIRLWDLKTGKCSWILRAHERYVTCSAFSSPDHPLLLASGSNDKSLMIWDLTNGRLTKNKDLSEFTTELCLKNKRIWCEYEKICKAKLISDGNKCVLQNEFISLNKADFNCCAFVGDSIVVASVGTGNNKDKPLYAWNIVTKEEIPLPFISSTPHVINHIEFSPDLSLLATASSEGNVNLYNFENQERTETLFHPNGGSLRVVRFSPDGSYLFTGGDDERGSIWSTKTYSLIKELKEHSSTIYGGAFTPDSTGIVTGDADGKLKLWNVRAGSENSSLYTCIGHELGVNTCDFSPEGFKGKGNGVQHFLLATGGNDGFVNLWQVSLGARVVGGGHIQLWKRFDNFGTANILTLAFSPSGKLLACGGDKVFRIFEVSSGSCIEAIEGHDRFVASLTFGNSCLLSCSSDGSVRVWKLNGSLGKEANRGGDSSNMLIEKMLFEWSCEEVRNWLKEIGRSDISENLNSLDGPKLMTLTDGELVSLYKIGDEGKRKQVLSEIKWLKIFGRQEALKRSKSSIYRPIPHNSKNKQPPPEFFCPITHDILIEPVSTIDGHTYEKCAIIEWFVSGKSSSPLTGLELESLALTPNFELQNRISEFLAANM